MKNWFRGERGLKIILMVGLVVALLLVFFIKILDGINELVVEYCVNTYHDKVDVFPEFYGMNDYSAMDVEVAEGIYLKGWLIYGQRKDPLIVLIPGYQGTRKTMLPYAQFLYEAGYSLFLFDPRGQGESDGEYICGNYLANDLCQIILILKKHGYSKFVLFGLSIGATGAIIAGSNNPDVVGVIADSGFANMREGLRKSPLCPARLLFDNPILYGLLLYFCQIYLHNYFGLWVNPFEATNALAAVEGGIQNVFIIHAKEDQLIPVYNALILFDKLKRVTRGIKRLWIVENSAHCENFTRYTKKYIQEVLRFLKEIQEGAKPSFLNYKINHISILNNIVLALNSN